MRLFSLVVLSVTLAGCGASDEEEIEQVINEISTSDDPAAFCEHFSDRGLVYLVDPDSVEDPDDVDDADVNIDELRAVCEADLEEELEAEGSPLESLDLIDVSIRGDDEAVVTLGAPDAEPMMLAMVRESGEWKIDGPAEDDSSAE